MTRDPWPVAIFAAAVLFATAYVRAEDLECTRYVPEIGKTVRVRCSDAVPVPAPAPAATEAVPPAAPAANALLGLTLTPLTAGLKDKFNIGDTIGGVFVTQVDERSEAAGRGVKRGDVIMQTNQDAVRTPEDLSRNIKSARDGGRKSILLLLRHMDGKLQFVSLPLG